MTVDFDKPTALLHYQCWKTEGVLGMAEMTPQTSTSSLSKTLRAMLWCIIGLLVAFLLIVVIELGSYHALIDISEWVSGTLTSIGFVAIVVCILGILISAIMLVVILAIKTYSLLQKDTSTQ